MKRHKPKQTRKDRVYLAYTSREQFIPVGGCWQRKSNRAGTWKQKLMQRGVAYWLAPCDLFSRPYRTQDYWPGDGITHNGPHQSLNKKMPYRLAYSPVLWRHFFNSGSSGLCQGDIQLSSTPTSLETLPESRSLGFFCTYKDSSSQEARWLQHRQCSTPGGFPRGGEPQV